MKRIIWTIALLCTMWLGAHAQSYALVDMEYILKNIPAYQRTNNELEQLSKQYQNQIDELQKQSENLYKTYRESMTRLNAAQKKQREDAIVAKDKEIYDLRMKYFGPEGELTKKRNDAMESVQDQVWQALKKLAQDNGLALIFDRSSSKIVYADPGMDISNSVLQQLGIKK